MPDASSCIHNLVQAIQHSLTLILLNVLQNLLFLQCLGACIVNKMYY